MDLIERQAAIDALYDWSEHSMTDAEAWHIRQVIGDIKSLPPAEPNCSEIPNNSDCISRQAAIDIERNATVDTNPMHFEAHQKFTQFMDDAEISSFGRWQWSNGFNTALTAVGIDLKKLPSAQPYTEAEIQTMQELEQAELQKAYECGRASAQPEIVRCKDCKHWEGERRGYFYYFEQCSLHERTASSDDFCSWAERREDG